jgi:hypothetical protein
MSPMQGWATRDGSDTIIAVWVVPGASRSSVVGEHGTALKVRVAAPPERGKANAAVAELLAGILDARVELEAGGATRSKRFRIRDMGPHEVAERLMF